MSVLNKDSIHSPVFSVRNKVYRTLWGMFYVIFLKFSPVQLFYVRNFFLRLFRASVNLDARVYSSAKIWSPENLSVGEGSTIGPRVNVYNQGAISIGFRVIISQDVTLCASTHDYNDPVHPLLLRPITIQDHAWICAEAFIGPGVTVGQGAVIGARAVLIKDAEPWCVYAGNPAVKIKERLRFNES